MKLKTKNPYEELAFTEGQPQYKKTTVKHKNLNPKWYEEFNLVVQDLDVEALRISVYNWDKVQFLDIIVYLKNQRFDYSLLYM